MPTWMRVPLALLIACEGAYMSLWPLAWLTILFQFLCFLVAHRGQYSLRSFRGWQDLSKDLGAALAKDPVLIELMTVRMFPGRVYSWGYAIKNACSFRFSSLLSLWRHPRVCARYIRRKIYRKHHHAKDQK